MPKEIDDATKAARKELHDMLHEDLAVDHCAGGRPNTDVVNIGLNIKTWSLILDALRDDT